MDEFERLEKRRDALVAEISVIDQLLAQIRVARHAARRLLGEESTKSGSGTEIWGDQLSGGLQAEGDTFQKNAKPRRFVRPEVAAFERVVKEVLNDSPKPMKRQEVMDALLQRGVEVGGQDPLNTLASRLTRMPGVENTRGKGYWLKSRMQKVEPPRAPNEAFQVGTASPEDFGL